MKAIPNSLRGTPADSHRFRFQWLVFFLLLLLCLSLASSARSETQERKLDDISLVKVFSPKEDSLAGIFSQLSPEESGLDFLMPIEADHPLRRLYVTGYAGGGLAIDDFNGDGLPDVFVSAGPHHSKLYLQNSPLRFKDHSVSSGISSYKGWHTGVASGDIDSDKDIDLIVCRYNKHPLLFLNDGSGGFREESKSFGLQFEDACMMPTLVDFDLDGRLDLFILNNRLFREGGFPGKAALQGTGANASLREELKKYYRTSKDAEGRIRVKNQGRQDLLYRNTLKEGRAYFQDVTKRSGIRDRGMGLSALWWDFNKDSYPDLYVANDFEEPDSLWLNLGNGSFRNVLEERIPHTTWFSMGSDFGDLNNDGHWDLLVADMAGSNHFRQKLAMGSMNNQRIIEVEGPPPQLMRNALLYGTGTERFLESAFMSSLAKTDWTWSVKILDLDNDGLQDVFFTNGASRDFMDADTIAGRTRFENIEEWDVFRNTPPRKEHNLAYKNKDGLHFQSAGEKWGLNHLGMSYGAATSDLDRDGDLDLLVMNLDETPTVYRNDLTSENSILIRLESTKSAPQGFGAHVTLTTSAGSQQRQLAPVRGFNSSDEPILHFGVASAEHIESLKIQWPQGAAQVFRNLKVNRFYEIREPLTSNEAVPAPVEPAPWYRSSDSLSSVAHQEREFDDFLAQPLLPNKLSQLGPGHAWGDVDKDGDYDLFIGGAAGHVGQLFVQNSQGQFVKQEFPALEFAKESEDMGVLFFDVEGDGDLDLYVVSGGVESPANSPNYQDRLYLNDGEGRFSLAPESSLPRKYSSGSAIAAADFDKDGDVDLFIGGRVLPGSYPNSSVNLLLENKSELSKPYFEEVSEIRATGLAESGMITSALWSDVDGDADLDLLLTREWGTPMLWRNDNGKLREESDKAGFSSHSGWWHGLSAADFDGDGDIDLAMSNFGLNTKYHASASEPVRVYSGTFIGNKEPSVIEAEYEDGVLFPVRGKGCSTAAIPGLAEKYSTYRDFALAELDEIYPEEELQQAKIWEAHTLESSVFINNGSGRFKRIPLGPLAQISPSFGILAGDFNADAKVDLMLAQNFYTPQLETGRMDSGLGLLMEGDGRGGFRELWPSESGLVIPGDAKGASLIDLNSDNRPDFAVAQNNDSMRSYFQENSQQRRYLKVKLVGKKGNPQAIGAKVTLRLPSGLRQMYEIYAGNSYLSHSPNELYFGLAAEQQTGELEIRWPDGSLQRKTLPIEPGVLEISQGEK